MANRSLLSHFARLGSFSILAAALACSAAAEDDGTPSGDQDTSELGANDNWQAPVVQKDGEKVAKGGGEAAEDSDEGPASDDSADADPGADVSPNCDSLLAKYDKVLAEAKTCNPWMKALQCTAEVADSLACPCPTFVNGGSPALDDLKQLAEHWKKADCGAGYFCPAVVCPAPSSASCSQQKSGGGLCVDDEGSPATK